MNKKVIFSLITVLFLILLTGGLFSFYYYSHLISYDENIVAGVKSDVRIARNGDGIPLIQAGNNEDLYFALGLVHGQDRFSLMEFNRAVANGFCSNAIGDKGNALDNLSRAVGFKRTAVEIFTNLKEPYVGYLKAYAAGVNLSKKKLDYDYIINRPWTAEDVLSVLLMKDWANSFLNNKELIFHISRNNKNESLNDLFPEDLLFFYNEDEKADVDFLMKTRGIVEAFIGPFNKGFAFYISGLNIEEEYPVTAYSFENILNVYPGWYPVHLNFNEVLIKGITFAGLPFIFAGDNGDISFFGFNVTIDTQDFIIERTRKVEGSLQYMSKTGWKNFKSFRETVNAADNKKRNFIIWYTDNGPVVSDIFGDEKASANTVTIQSSFPGPDYIVSLFEIPMSTDVDMARVLINNINSNPRVYLFASDEYALGAYCGRFPWRNHENTVFKPGPASGWTGWKDLSQYNNKSMFTMTVGSSFLEGVPDEIKTFSLNDDVRYSRLTALLDERSEYKVSDVENILHDTHSPVAEYFTPMLIAILKDNPITSARLSRILFQNWNFNINADVVAPTIFHTFLQKYIQETITDELKDDTDRIMDSYQLLIPGFFTMVKEQESRLFDDRTTFKKENYAGIFDRSFLKTMRILNRKQGPIMENWRWGELHRGKFNIPWLKKTIFAARAKDMPFSGSYSTIYKGKMKTGMKPSEVTSLTGYYAKEASSFFMNYSCSINPWSAFYYGKGKEPGTRMGFDKISSDYQTTLRPAK